MEAQGGSDISGDTNIAEGSFIPDVLYTTLTEEENQD